MKFLFSALVLGLAVGQHRIDADGILFPDSARFVYDGNNGPVPLTERRKTSSDLARSIEMAKKISSFNSVEEFLAHVKNVPTVESGPRLTSRFGGEERSKVEFAKPAGCAPELRTVPMKDSNEDPSLIYYPSCTRIKRCGGCCDHGLLSCQPNSTQIKNFQIYVSKLGDGGQLEYGWKEIVPLEEHTTCKCECKVKAEHCGRKQEYLEDECRCSCANIDEEEKCRRDSEMKLWDSEKCACLCRTTHPCSTGLFFDQSTCSCKQASIRQRWFDRARTQYQTPFSGGTRESSPVIITMDASDPRRKHKDEPKGYK